MFMGRNLNSIPVSLLAGVSRLGGQPWLLLLQFERTAGLSHLSSCARFTHPSFLLGAGSAHQPVCLNSGGNPLDHGALLFFQLYFDMLQIFGGLRILM